jgi:predicted nucleic acid-binding protein
LNDLPQGSLVCIDANVLVYYVSATSPQSRSFVANLASGIISGWIGANSLAEVTHRLMVLEAQRKQLVSGGNPARKLKEKPEVVRSLTDYQADVNAIMSIVSDVHPVTPQIIKRSAAIRAQHGLLTNDSLTLALMEAHGTSMLVTADRDFLRIPDIEVYLPSDI